MGVWEAMEMLNTLIDESDPDVSESEKMFVFTHAHRYLAQTSQSQIEHLLQTAEAIRRDGKPEWMQVGISALSRFSAFDVHQVTGLVHDLGKLLLMFGSQGQWDVVGVS
jgi:inositol oxygenase